MGNPFLPADSSLASPLRAGNGEAALRSLRFHRSRQKFVIPRRAVSGAEVLPQNLPVCGPVSVDRAAIQEDSAVPLDRRSATAAQPVRSATAVAELAQAPRTAVWAAPVWAV